MARDTADFAQQSSERAMQAATFGLTWAREMAEESTANFAFQPRELPRIVLDTLEHQVEFVEEAHT